MYVLKAKSLYSIANRTKEKPTIDELKIEKWERDDAVAMFMISSAKDLSQVTLVESCSTSKEMLEKLDFIFKLKSHFNNMLLLLVKS